MCFGPVRVLFLSFNRQTEKKNTTVDIYFHSLIEANRFEELEPESSDKVRTFEEDFEVDAVLVDEEDPPPLARRSLARFPVASRPQKIVKSQAAVDSSVHRSVGCSLGRFLAWLITRSSVVLFVARWLEHSVPKNKSLPKANTQLKVNDTTPYPLVA